MEVIAGEKQEQAGLWVRVSSGGQDEANQIPDLLSYCAKQGYNPKLTYEVHGKSASKGKHQSYLDQAVEDMRSGLITVLVVWKSSRIERRGAFSVFDLARKVQEAGGRIEYVGDAYLNAANDMSDVLLALAASRDKQYADDLSANTIIGHNRGRANMALTGRTPWGFTSDGPKYDRRMVPTNEGIVYVPQIYDRVIKGESLPSIAAWLHSQGVMSSTGGLWWEKSLSQMIRNPAYRGSRCEQDPQTKRYGKILHKCPPLVDADIWRAANANLDARPHRGRTFAENKAMLADVLTCPKCAGPMYRVMSQTSVKGQPVKVPYYRCSGTGPARRSTCRNMVRTELADDAVNTIIAATFGTPVMTRVLVPGHDHAAQIADLRYEMQQVMIRDLTWDEQMSELARLKAELDGLAALPSVPDRWEETATGETHSDVWKALETHERGPWLVSQRFTITATREAVTVSQGSVSATVTL
jgi:DNA invertase Pin-like site-specific DNA recombinase